LPVHCSDDCITGLADKRRDPLQAIPIAPPEHGRELIGKIRDFLVRDPIETTASRSFELFSKAQDKIKKLLLYAAALRLPFGVLGHFHGVILSFSVFEKASGNCKFSACCSPLN
jgi:hypothetical protein